MTEPRIAVEIDMAPEVWGQEAGEHLTDEVAVCLADELAEQVRRELPDAELSMTRTVRMDSGDRNRIATVRLADDEPATARQREAMRSLEAQLNTWARGLLNERE